MSFDFDTVVDRRGTDSTKHERFAGKDILPLWVADMDFKSPAPVIEALAERVAHGVFGYIDTPPELIDLIIERLKRLYDWSIVAEDLVFLPGVVPGLNIACRALTGPNESVVTSVPIYPPFMEAPAFCDRKLTKLRAPLDAQGWQFPLSQLDDVTKDARLLLLSNPYNPVGRVFTASELTAIVDVCKRKGLWICSDEIHCDLLFDGRLHVPMASLSREAADISVTLMAPSKTFNLAGFGGSFAVIQNPELRARFCAAMNGIVPHVNIMAYVGMQAAYRDGEAWRRALVTYLEGNRDYLYTAFESMSGISMNRVEATYLAWLDVSNLALKDAPAFFEAAGIGMAEGVRFGDDRFMRLNFGCPRSVLEQAIMRFQSVLLCGN